MSAALVRSTFSKQQQYNVVVRQHIVAFTFLILIHNTVLPRIKLITYSVRQIVPLPHI